MRMEPDGFPQTDRASISLFLAFLSLITGEILCFAPASLSAREDQDPRALLGSRTAHSVSQRMSVRYSDFGQNIVVLIEEDQSERYFTPPGML